MTRVRVFFVIAATLAGLPGCTSSNFSDMLKGGGETAQASAVMPGDPPPPGVAVVAEAPKSPGPGLLGADPKDDLSVAKQHFRQENYGLAEHYFRRAAEGHPRDAEAWLGLAASYDRLHRFELADRAYKQVIVLTGTTPEILNNQGYSYILRGDYGSARAKLAEARALDPENPYILNNIRLLEESSRKSKSVQR